MEKQLTIGLTVDEVNTVLEALAELPAKRSMELINNIIQQAQPQMEDGDNEPETEPEGA